MSRTRNRASRIVRKADFEQAYATGKRRVSNYFVSFVLPNELGRVRLGVVASRRVGNAVSRNRAKRLLREVFRCTPVSVSEGRDLVLIARRAIVDTKMQRVQRDFRRYVLPMLTSNEERSS